MQKYQDIVLYAGEPYVGATVSVQTYPSGGTPTIYSDNGVTPYPSNILTTDINGRFYFYAADGHYQLVVSGPQIVTQNITDILLADVVTSYLETPTGVINGTNVTFNLANIPNAPNSVMGFVRQGGFGAFLPCIEGIDFTIPAASTTITMTIAPASGSNLYFTYAY